MADDVKTSDDELKKARNALYAAWARSRDDSRIVEINAMILIIDAMLGDNFPEDEDRK